MCSTKMFHCRIQWGKAILCVVFIQENVTIFIVTRVVVLSTAITHMVETATKINTYSSVNTSLASTTSTASASASKTRRFLNKNLLVLLSYTIGLHMFSMLVKL